MCPFHRRGTSLRGVEAPPGLPSLQPQPEPILPARPWAAPSLPPAPLAPPAASPRPHPPQYATNLQTRCWCPWQRHRPGAGSAASAQLGCTTGTEGVLAAPSPRVSRARLKPHVRRPGADPIAGGTFRTYTAGGTACPWAAPLVPDPGPSPQSPLVPTPPRPEPWLHNAEARGARSCEGLNRRQQVQGREKTGSPGLSVWMEERKPGRRGAGEGGG